jgi:SdrD B-like domain
MQPDSFPRARLALLVLASLVMAACAPVTAAPSTATPPASTPVAPPPVTPTTPPPGSPTPSAPTPTGVAMETGRAPVDSFDILVLESFPVQINLVVRGNLPDACTTIDSVTQSRRGNTFVVTLKTTRPAGALCGAVLVPYEQRVPLDVQGLPKGTYTVEVNGVTDSFTLSVDNVLGSETGSIGGLVWDDHCDPGGEGQPAPTQPPLPCAAQPDGTLTANGLFDNGEHRLPGVLVLLGQGPCQSVGLASATTDADGQYRFADLAPGEYCVSINPLVEPNVGVLLPGIFTFPSLEQGSASVTLGPGENKMGVDFGWDYQLR